MKRASLGADPIIAGQVVSNGAGPAPSSLPVTRFFHRLRVEFSEGFIFQYHEDRT
jgi:hypothetical protein